NFFRFGPPIRIAEHAHCFYDPGLILHFGKRGFHVWPCSYRSKNRFAHGSILIDANALYAKYPVGTRKIIVGRLVGRKQKQGPEGRKSDGKPQEIEQEIEFPFQKVSKSYLKEG